MMEESLVSKNQNCSNLNDFIEIKMNKLNTIQRARAFEWILTQLIGCNNK